MKSKKQSQGFTLIEVMITVGIIAILSAIAVPAYQQYVRRGKVQEPILVLMDARLRLTQHAADNQGSFAGLFNAVCVPPAGVTPLLSNTKYFTYTCVTSAASYLITATGRADRDMAGYIYTINEQNAKTSTIPNVAPCGSAWIAKSSDSCS